MKEIEKSLRYFFLIIALLLSSQVFGSSVSQNGSFFYAIFAIIIFGSGITGLFRKCDLITAGLCNRILLVVIVFCVIMPQLWPLYLLYFAYCLTDGIMCIVRYKKRKNADEENE